VKRGEHHGLGKERDIFEFPRIDPELSVNQTEMMIDESFELIMIISKGRKGNQMVIGAAVD
jgi:hypothetical protein